MARKPAKSGGGEIQPPQTPTPIAPPRAGAAAAGAPPDALQVLGELELLRRKVDLLERRVAAWDAALNEVRLTVEGQSGDAPEAELARAADLAELAHRVSRLERRRADAQRGAPTQAPPPSALTGPRPDSGEQPVVIVKARWAPAEAGPGDEVMMTARTDGIEADTEVRFVVQALSTAEPVIEITGRCDGEEVTASWTIPDPAPYPELFFEVRHQGWAARSPILVLPLGKKKRKARS